MRILSILLVLSVPAVADSFLTSVAFVPNPDVDCPHNIKEALDLMSYSSKPAHHMAVLQTIYINETDIDPDELIRVLEEADTNDLAHFDLGFAMVLFNTDPYGLRYLGEATDMLDTPDAHLGFALCIAQIDAFGPDASDWDSPSLRKQDALDQMLACWKMSDSWDIYLRATYESAVDYMGYYDGYKKYKQWKQITRIPEED